MKRVSADFTDGNKGYLFSYFKTSKLRM